MPPRPPSTEAPRPSYARLVIQSGLSRITLRGEPGLGSRVHTTFEGPPPKVEEKGGTVKIRQGKGWPWKRSVGEIVLSSDVPWEVEIRGGVSNVKADFSQVTLRGIHVSGGASELSLHLGRPAGTCAVHLSGGAASLTIRRPPAVGIRVHAGGGASHLTLDQFFFESVGGALRWESADYRTVTDRYDVELSGGSSTLTIGTS